MKRLLPFIPIILLLFLGNSCVDTQSIVATALATQLATPMTPTSISTYNTELSNMISAINTDLSAASPLGWIMDAQYYVIDVTFDDNSPRKDGIAFVHVDCVCMNSTNCCIPERTFVVVVESMRKSHRNGYVPLKAFEGVGEFRVICSDITTKAEIGTMSAPWKEVEAYLMDEKPDLPSKHPLRGHTVRLEK